MKKLNKTGSVFRGLTTALAVLSCATVAKAIPYASGLLQTNIGGSNYVQFIVNEGGAAVSVVTLPSGASNVISASLPRGATNFFLGADTSYKIYVAKQGNGASSQISSDAADFGTHGYGTGVATSSSTGRLRGLDVNKNAARGVSFGRIYVGVNGNTGGTAFLQQGLYAFNSDFSDSYLGKNQTASGTSANTFLPANASSPYKMTVAADGNLYVTVFATASASVFQFNDDLSVSNLVLAPYGENQGLAAGTHGDPGGVYVTGSPGSNLVVYTFDPALGLPNGVTGLGATSWEGVSTAGQFNDIYRYDIGNAAFPWPSPPVFGVNTGLPGFQDSQTGDVTFGTDPTKIIALFYRANLSDPCIQVFDQATGNLLYASQTVNGGPDVFQLAYSGVRVSPDGRYLATIDQNNVFIIANLTNGIPDNSSIFRITTGLTAFSHGMGFDAADNLYCASGGSGIVRSYSLGISAIAVTGNDTTGSNGTFTLTLPSTTATISASTNIASQNYVNNVTSPGTPIPGAFLISLNTNNLSAGPVVVNYTLTGTGIINTNYTINAGTNATTGIIITSNTITFPATVNPLGGNWSATVLITPTAIPVSGPTYTVIASLVGGPTYVTLPPITATVFIKNTGPQFLFLGAASSGSSMNRGIPNDYAKFVLTRWGDTNGPNNTSLGISPLSYTVTNITYGGTALFPADYTDQAQRLDPAGNGVAVVPIATNGIVINPGDVTITCVVGGAVPRTGTNVLQIPTNATVTLNLTNSVATNNGTVAFSAQGTSYVVSNVVATVTEVDNAVGAEVVIWNNPLTNANDNTWTLTYANTNLASAPVLPVVVPNYTNTQTAISGGSTNDFDVLFGHPVSSDLIPASPVMTANGWTTALRMTVNKNLASPAAVNVYPQGQNFVGNVALRFSMYLSLYEFATNNPGLVAGREFALFGMDTSGTNCDWRPTATPAAGTGAGVTNWDGQWVSIDSGAGSLTPADYDSFTAPAKPNNSGVDTDTVSSANTAAVPVGAFKNPPFNTETPAGGDPANTWVDVSLEKTQLFLTNEFQFVTLVDRQAVISTFYSTNSTTSFAYTNGNIMLGYEDPSKEVSDSTAFVYYSNVRVVELSPFVSIPATTNLIFLSGASFSLTNSATYATVPGITNQWYTGAGTALNLIQTDTNASTNITSTLAVANITKGTNYIAVARDSAGSITNTAIVDVVGTTPNVAINAGGKATFTAAFSGQGAPTYQWKTNGVNLANGTKYTNVTTVSLSISNCQSGDAAVTYSVAVTFGGQTVTPAAATLTINAAPSGSTIAPTAQTNVWGSSASFTVTTPTGTAPLTNGWKHGATALANGTKYSGATGTGNTLTISNLTAADAGTYTVSVTNIAGNATSAAATLVVVTPPPTLAPAVVVGANVTLKFSSTNSFDNTNAFVLQSSPNVGGPYTNTVGSVITGTGPFTATVPVGGTNMFYRLQHVP